MQQVSITFSWLHLSFFLHKYVIYDLITKVVYVIAIKTMSCCSLCVPYKSNGQTQKTPS